MSQPPPYYAPSQPPPPRGGGNGKLIGVVVASAVALVAVVGGVLAAASDEVATPNGPQVGPIAAHPTSTADPRTGRSRCPAHPAPPRRGARELPAAGQGALLRYDGEVDHGFRLNGLMLSD
jgi:hypothetical protein